VADVLKYGDKIFLQNAWDNWNGGFLDTNNIDRTAAGSKLDVSTAASSGRDRNSGHWIITSVDGKAPGVEVVAGDAVYLQNMYGGDGGYLDTNGGGSAPQSKYGVSTSITKDRGAGTGRWRVFAETSSPVDSKVRVGDRVHLLNGWDNWNGGFLDTNGSGPTESKHGVYTQCHLA